MATQRAKEDGWQVFFLLSFKSYKEINVWTAERITTTRAHTHTQSRELKRYPIIFRLLNWVFDRRSKNAIRFPLWFVSISALFSLHFFFRPFLLLGMFLASFSFKEKERRPVKLAEALHAISSSFFLRLSFRLWHTSLNIYLLLDVYLYQFLPWYGKCRGKSYAIIEMWRHSPHRQDVHTRHISKA